ncbi:TPA: hypothetical protein JIS15_09930 [Acinetobacter baumannii]|nr:hypothetical protein [Acinetobacter baumannii]
MRKESILELIDEVDETLITIRSYRKISRPKVKSIFEHMRSALEYLAQDINEKLVKPKKGISFPYGLTKELFDNSINKNFSALSTDLPDIYNEILQIQPFSCGDDWLNKLCKLTNDAKHKDAIDIKHNGEVVKSASINMGPIGFVNLGPNSKNIVVQNIRVDGKRYDDFIYDEGKLLVTRKGELSIDFKITKDKKILIGDDLLDLIPFLEKCQINLKIFIEKIYSIIEKSS